MKLYATTTSERASKGQGGNDYISIKLLMEDGETFANLYYHTNEEGEYELLNEDNDEIIYTKRQKAINKV